jgi:hypothetical protein
MIGVLVRMVSFLCESGGRERRNLLHGIACGRGVQACHRKLRNTL